MNGAILAITIIVIGSFDGFREVFVESSRSFRFTVAASTAGHRLLTCGVPRAIQPPQQPSTYG